MQEIRAELERLLGEAPEQLAPLAGGDVGRSLRARLPRHGEVFVKTYRGSAGAAMVDAEARGLAWLAEARALRVPAVLAATRPGEAATPLLVLEWIEVADPPDERSDETLGRGLAALHRAGADDFGLASDNFIGRLPQSNRPARSWVDFYRRRRLEPLLQRARQRGLSSTRLDADADRLLDRLADLVGPDEPPARLHGDLWAGNCLRAAGGQPVLIDPAVHGGHREVDLAMMRLFGGFSQRVFDVYQEAAPLAPGHRERVPLYQLYPLLVHLNLFGAGYAGAVAGAIRDCMASRPGAR